MDFLANASQENFVWRIHYEATDAEGNHEVVDEYDAEYPTGRGFATVDLSRVQALELIPQRPWLRSHIVKIDQSQGMRPIFFRRRSITLDPTLETELGRATATCVGFQKTLEVGGERRNVSSYVFIFGDGSTLTTDDHSVF